MAVIGGGERDLTIKLLADVDNFKKNMDKASGQTDSFANKSGAALKKVGVAVAAAAAAAGAFAVKFGVDAVKAASDLQETLSKTAQLFGENAAEVEKFAATAATKLGQSKQQALDAAANFAIFGKAAGLAGSDLVNFSTDFTVLASDLASFNNTSPEEAINAIGSALRGEAEPLRKYGVLLDDASLRQAALELGIVNTTKNALTPQQKVLAAQKLIFEQTTAAQGDFARTSDGLANGQRILAAQFENVKTTVGNALLPVVTQLFQVILNDVVPIFKTLADDFSRNLLPILDRVFRIIQRDLFPVFKVLGEFILKDLVPTIRDFFRPIIDILITGIQFLISKVKENAEGFSVFLGIVDRVWQFIKTYVIPLFQTAFVTAINLVFRQIGNLIDAFGTVFEIIGKVARFLGFDLSFELDKSTGKIAKQNRGLADAYLQFQDYSRVVKQEVVPSVINFTNATNSLTSSKEKAAATTEKLTNKTKEITKATKEAKQANDDYVKSVAMREFVDAEVTKTFAGGAGSIVGAFGGAGDAAALQALIATAENTRLSNLNLDALKDFGSAADLEIVQLAEQVKALGAGEIGFRDLKQMFDVFRMTNIPFVTAGSPESLVASLGRRGATAAEKEQFVQEVNIYVQGALADPEGTARAVQQVIQDSNARSGFQQLTPVLALE